ncbi:MAG: methyltransferase [Planctomycetota bacterium]|nr:methyltransferase [Planctomycetota bacterium]
MVSRKRIEKLREERALERRLRVPLAEQTLIDALERLTEFHGGRVLTTSLGRGQFAIAAERTLQAAHTTCHFLELYKSKEALRHIADEASEVNVVCTADLPEDEVDLAAIPVDTRGEAELTREWLQQMHARLRIGGKLIAASGNPDDQWLHEEFRRLFQKVTRTPGRKSVLYSATKTEPLEKPKSFECEFAFRDEGRLIKAFSRPGVFSHRSLDTGARALMNSLELGPDCQFVDFGCGSGAVGLAAALRAPAGAVLALDSNPRAVECTLKGAEVNGITTLTAVLDDEGQGGDKGTYDVVGGNPPYYSDYRIAELFLRAARRLLKPEGRVLMVTKTPAWFDEQMPKMFDDVTIREERAYHIASGRKRV